MSRSCLHPRRLRLAAVGLAFAGALAAGVASATPLVVDFSDLTLPANSFFNGGPTPGTSTWTSQGVSFGNGFTDWGGGFTSWNGFAYSNVNDPVTEGFTNQYAAFAGPAHAGSIYAVGYSGPRAFIDLPTGYLPASVRVTNTTYTALDMANGSGFSRQFGPGDSLSVTFTGYSGAAGTGSPTGNTTFFLGDFRDGKSLIVNTWELLDLAPLVTQGTPASIRLTWASTDVNQWGIRTPTYVALDSLALVPVPEPAAWLLAAVGLAAAAAVRRRGR